MILIVNYGMGNLRSIEKALLKLNQKYIISNKAEDFKKATHIILPGVGFFKKGMFNLRKKKIDELLYKEVIINKKPLLGICLGMQLLFDTSEEGGIVKGLGFLKGEVTKFSFKDNSFKIPHVGWNSLLFDEKNIHELLKNIKPNTDFYFVHSYKVSFFSDEQNVYCAYTNYENNFVSFICKDNIAGIQFHPEKSQIAGITLLKNFVNWSP